MKFHVGTSGYGYKEWQGIFYPERISPKDMLSFYSERFNAVEINYTYHHMPTARLLDTWMSLVPETFVFVLKAPKVITHVKRLKEVNEEADYLFRTVLLLGSRLGAILLQFPAFFRADLPRLEAFLDLIPEVVHCAFEFRSPTWVEAGAGELLCGRGHTLCTADTDDDPARGIVGAQPWGYLRLRRSGYTDADLAQWLERARSQEWERAFVFFKHEEEALGPKLALRFLELAGEQQGNSKDT